MGYIYKITNKETGKMYIGQTCQDLHERWRSHRSSRSSCRYLKLAIKKYGIYNFDFKLICICFDSDMDILKPEKV
jgi:group I intron endonuclease